MNVFQKIVGGVEVLIVFVAVDVISVANTRSINVDYRRRANSGVPNSKFPRWTLGQELAKIDIAACVGFVGRCIDVLD